jgi:hypothetical protein
MDVTTYDRETHESSYYDEQTQESQCYGCYLLERGEGGENQLGHMGPGGCLYQEESESDSCQDIETNETIKNTVICNIEIPNLKLCIICSDKGQLKTNNLICSMCQSKEDRKREIRYQSFIADSYAISN